MIQLVAPNFSTKGRLGFCLEYARECFGAPAVEPNAWEAWRGAQFKHADHNIPTDVSVPCWFSYILNGVNLGHVVISTPSGFYSSPWKLGTDHAVLPSIEEVERIYGVVYVGWSEDISKVRVVKETDMFTPAEINTLCAIAFNRQAREDEKTTYSALPIQEVLNRIEGGDENKSLRSDAQSFRDGNAAPAQQLKPGLYKV